MPSLYIVNDNRPIPIIGASLLVLSCLFFVRQSLQWQRHCWLTVLLKCQSNDDVWRYANDLWGRRSRHRPWLKLLGRWVQLWTADGEHVGWARSADGDTSWVAGNTCSYAGQTSRSGTRSRCFSETVVCHSSTGTNIVSVCTLCSDYVSSYYFAFILKVLLFRLSRWPAVLKSFLKRKLVVIWVRSIFWTLSLLQFTYCSVTSCLCPLKALIINYVNSVCVFAFACGIILNCSVLACWTKFEFLDFQERYFN